jgi:hypothetical protein
VRKLNSGEWIFEMSKPTTKAGTESLMTENHTELLNRIATIETAMLNNHNLLQVAIEEINKNIADLLKVSTGTKKAIKPAEEGTGEVKTPTVKVVKARKETANIFFTRRCIESPEFKAKYANDTIIKQCPESEKGKKVKALATINAVIALSALKAEFLAEYNASTGVAEAVVEEHKDA